MGYRLGHARDDIEMGIEGWLAPTITAMVPRLGVAQEERPVAQIGEVCDPGAAAPSLAGGVSRGSPARGVVRLGVLGLLGRVAIVWRKKEEEPPVGSRRRLRVTSNRCPRATLTRPYAATRYDSDDRLVSVLLQLESHACRAPRREGEMRRLQDAPSTADPSGRRWQLARVRRIDPRRSRAGARRFLGSMVWTLPCRRTRDDQDRRRTCREDRRGKGRHRRSSRDRFALRHPKHSNDDSLSWGERSAALERCAARSRDHGGVGGLGPRALDGARIDA
jgi:hypothetical protein